MNPRNTGHHHIGINAHLLSLSASYRGAGIHRYIHALLDYLPRVSDHRFIAYLGDPRTRHVDWRGLICRFTPFATTQPLARIAWEQLCQPLAVVRDRIDLLHGPAYALPLSCPTRAVVTVHDLSFLLFPQAFTRARRLYLSLMTRLAVQRAEAVITVSRHTRGDLVRLTEVPASRVHVVPNGVDPTFRPLDSAEVETFRRRRGLPEAMILCVGTIEPRKNLESLIQAYARLRQDPAMDHMLVIGGGQSWQCQRVFALVESLDLRDDVWFPGFINDAELPLWYNAADVFVFPSIYEGFGLPALEAMACGTPVIASNASSLPEVVGEAGRLIAPHDIEELAETIRQVLTDASQRESMRAQGLERAAGYSWRATVQHTVEVYNRVLGGAA